MGSDPVEVVNAAGRDRMSCFARDDLVGVYGTGMPRCIVRMRSGVSVTSMVCPSPT
jgi:hypothetical protein